jgi:hypothetical protein
VTEHRALRHDSFGSWLSENALVEVGTTLDHALDAVALCPIFAAFRLRTNLALRRPSRAHDALGEPHELIDFVRAPVLRRTPMPIPAQSSSGLIFRAAGLEVVVKQGKRCVHDLPDGAQRMILPHTRIEVNIGKQRS